MRIKGQYAAPMPALNEPVGSEFGRWCKRRMAELGLRQRPFADAVGIKSSGTVSKILNGTDAVPPPLGVDLERWAEVLDIPEAELPRFRLMAYIGHVPEAIRPMMETLIDEHLALKADYADLLSQVRRVADAPTDDGSRRGGGA